MQEIAGLAGWHHSGPNWERRILDRINKIYGMIADPILLILPIAFLKINFRNNGQIFWTGLQD